MIFVPSVKTRDSSEIEIKGIGREWEGISANAGRFVEFFFCVFLLPPTGATGHGMGGLDRWSTWNAWQRELNRERQTEKKEDILK